MARSFHRALILVPIVGLLILALPEAQPLAAPGTSDQQMTKLQKRLFLGSLPEQPSRQSASPQAQSRAGYSPTSDDGCPVNRGDNFKVNQNCLNLTDASLQGRGQAENETAIAVDPLSPQHLVGVYNDYLRGDGNCGGAFSLDAGRTWADTTMPTGFTRGATFGGVAREYWQAGTDPSIAWDTHNNAYYLCELFQRGPGTTNNPDQSSALFVFRSTHNFGASWNFPGRTVTQTFVTGTASGLPTLDKPYLTIDNHSGSPFKDRIYVTWTLFDTDGTANIFEAFSNDYGETFSSPVIVSTTSSLCPNSVGSSGHCDANQFSQPFTGPDGNLYVIWDNFNNALKAANDNRNQILLAKSSDGGQTFGPPIKVADYFDLPDCAPYQNGQDFGRACVPEKGSAQNSVFRATNYGSGAVNPEDSSQVVVTFGSYINRFSNETNGCVPAGLDPQDGNNEYTGVKTPGACNNKIVLSVSNDGGATFTGTATDPRMLPTVNTQDQAGKDQWWQWATFNQAGKLAVSYYDRSYGQDEFNGSSDVSLSGSRNLESFGVVRVTSSSMPLPTEFPDAQGNSLFWGDYSGLTAADKAFPLWMDTRDPDVFLCPGTAAPGVPPQVCTLTQPSGILANDENIYSAGVSIPSGGEGNDNGSDH